MRSPELPDKQRDMLSLQLTPEVQAEILAKHSPEEVRYLGERVLTDVFRRNPKNPDVSNAPKSFARSCERLVQIAETPEQAFDIIGGAVIVARHYTNEFGAFK